MQSGGAVSGEIAWFVEFVGRVGESDGFAVCGGEGGVAGIPGPVGNGVVEVGLVGGEEERPEVGAGERRNCVRADLPCAGEC